MCTRQNHKDLLLAIAVIHSDMMIASDAIKTLTFSIHYQINFRFLSWTLKVLHNPVLSSLPLRMLTHLLVLRIFEIFLSNHSQSFQDFLKKQVTLIRFVSTSLLCVCDHIGIFSFMVFLYIILYHKNSLK